MSPLAYTYAVRIIKDSHLLLTVSKEETNLTNKFKAARKHAIQ